MLVEILDILAAIITVITLNLIPKSYKWWLGYGVGAGLFIIVMVAKHLPGMTVMGIVLIMTAIKNYLIGKKNEIKHF